MTRCIARLAGAAVLTATCLAPVTAHGLINTYLQPVDLCRRYDAVLSGEVTAVDAAAGTFAVRIERVHQGDAPAGRTITIAAGDDMKRILASADGDGRLRRGGRWVAFAGRRRRRHEDDCLFYTEAGFGIGTIDSPERWVWDDDDLEIVGEDGQAVPTLGGTWSGSAATLERLVADIAAGRAFFPRKAYCRFRPDWPVARLAGPARGVALYDVDGDGDLDVYACSDAGDALLLHVSPEPGEPVGFADATDYVGLAGLATPSCSFADANADGRADLLAGGAVYLAGERLKGRFTRSDLLPEGADRGLKAAAFVELNGDGYPDVIVSRSGGGLRAWLNPGPKGRSFTDATAAMGLDRKACGAGLDGFFAPGDWNGDGRADLFYAAGDGLLLVQNAAGVFEPLPHGTHFDFRSGPQRQAGLTGAGCFTPLLGFDRLDLVVPNENGWTLLAYQAGTPRDVTGYGGEISEGSHLHLATVAEDLNVDGLPDLYTVSRAPNGHNRFLINRGYGVFMHAAKNTHYGPIFRGPAHQSGGWGAAAGDVDGDGANDLLLGNAHGVLTLLLNDTLSVRRPVEHPIDDLQQLLDARILTVHVRGRVGVLGARVTLADANGQVVARRDVGSNVATGCRGPDTVNLAVLRPGRYTLAVRYGDGDARTWPVDLSEAKPVVLTADRDAPAAAAEP